MSDNASKEAFRRFPDDGTTYSAAAMRHAFVQGARLADKLDDEPPPYCKARNLTPYDPRDCYRDRGCPCKPR